MAAEARRLLARHGLRLFLLLLPFHAAIVAIAWRIPEDTEGRETAVPALMVWLLFVIESLALAAAALLIDGARRGSDLSLARVWRRTAALTPRLVATHLLTTALLVPGLVLLVYPGVIAATWFAFAPLAVALEGLAGLAALRASHARKAGVRELLILNLPVLVPVAIQQNLPPLWPVLALAALAGAGIAAWTSVWAVLRYTR